MAQYSTSQARPPRNNQRNFARRPQQTANATVPSTQQVRPGASVSIVLKADQRTGREVQGVVQDLLTRGDHPRGIKVRLQDGRVGRVQSILTANTGSIATTTTESTPPPNQQAWKPKSRRGKYGNEDEHPQEPPPRNLADFFPQEESNEPVPDSPPGERVTFSSATMTCPICGLFEGDETAVQHHVQEHLD